MQDLSIFYGALCIRPEQCITLAEEPYGMANNLTTLSLITQDAVRLFRNSNSFLARLNWDDGTRLEPQALSLPLTLEAYNRSMELLHSWLTSEQLESFKEREYFEVTGGSSGVRYRLHPKYSFGIEVLEGPQARDLLCVVPQGAPALGDILLAQKIGLERDEEATLKIANVSSYRRLYADW